MAYRVWSKAKAGKPVVMTISEIKNALALGVLGLDDEYEGHGEGAGRTRVRLGDVPVFRDAGLKAPVKGTRVEAAQQPSVSAMIEARRRSLQAAAPKPSADEQTAPSGMQVSWRACLISLGLSFAACPALISGTRMWVIIASLVGLLFVIQVLRDQEEVKPSLFITPIVFGLVAYWALDTHLGSWFNGVMTMALCLAGTLMVDEFSSRFAGSFGDRLFIFIKYAYALTFSVWLGWAGFDDLPRYLTITKPAFGKGGEQAILLSLVALPVLVFVVLGLLAGVFAAVLWLKDGPSKQSKLNE